MSSSYVSSHAHIVFSTKNRLRAIPEDLQPKLYADSFSNIMIGDAVLPSLHWGFLSHPCALQSKRRAASPHGRPGKTFKSKQIQEKVAAHAGCARPSGVC